MILHRKDTRVLTFENFTQYLAPKTPRWLKKKGVIVMVAEVAVKTAR